MQGACLEGLETFSLWAVIWEAREKVTISCPLYCLMHKAVSNLPLPAVCEEMLIISDYEIYFFLESQKSHC